MTPVRAAHRDSTGSDERSPIPIARELSRRVNAIRFGSPVAHVYNPLDYARASYESYVSRYGNGERDVLMFGMNPGPWGMSQTGVPFGEVSLVRDWLDIVEPVGKPPREHPRRPVQGFQCPRSEVSGRRLWGWARDQFDSPQRFFKQFFVANYCPLAFLESSGRNRTPDQLPAHEREPLFAACDSALRRTVEYFHPRFVVGIGAFAEKRAQTALAGMDVRIARIHHPSPASPTANRDWAKLATRQLCDAGIKLPN